MGTPKENTEKTKFMLSSHRYEEIKTSVVGTFEKYDIHCAPISGFEIAAKMGIKIAPYSAYRQSVQNKMLDVSEDGFHIKLISGENFIFYHDGKPYGRVNYTIMHEIAHIILDHSEHSALAEAEANFFAKFALAPPVLIHKFGLRDFYEVAERFEISYEAADYAFQYYQKWLNHGGTFYKDYETRLCNLFGVAV